MIRFRPLPWLTAFSIAALVLLLVLGHWQWTRFEAKRAARAAGPEMVTLARFTPEPGKLQLVYGIWNGAPVWRVFAPVSHADGVTFLDTGALPGPVPPDWRAIAEPFTAEAAVRGVAVRPSPAGPFAPKPNAEKRTWYAADPPAMAAAAGLSRPTAYYLALDYVGPDGALIPNPFAAMGGDPLPPERHLGYALTWWGLAAALLAVYAAFHIRLGRLSLGGLKA